MPPRPAGAVRDCACGRGVVLRGARISFNRRRGIMHWIEHRDGSKVCEEGAWSCAAFKPYPKAEAEKEYAKLLARWECAAVTTLARPGGAG
jgi:hypothetical protein